MTRRRGGANHGGITVIDFDISQLEFWTRPPAEREQAFARLRALEHPAFFEEIDLPWAPRGPGYYALVKHADVVEASRNPKVFCSGRGGATGIPDMPTEFTEYFGSMINMDDPRHARMRRIVSRSFTSATVTRLADQVSTTSSRIVDDLLAGGPGRDFVAEAAARLPLSVIFMRRKLTCDFELNGHRYREGDKAVLFYCSANLDEAVFDDPYRFDITRNPNPHVGFGAAGPHFCLGAHLARLEIATLLGELLRRIPTIQGSDPDRLHSNFINGIKHLTYTF